MINGHVKWATNLNVWEMLVAEAQAFVGRSYFNRTQEGGTVKSKGFELYCINAGDVKITVYRPQGCNSENAFHNRFGEFRKRNSAMVEKLTLKM